MNLTNLEKVLKNEPKYRIKQINEAIYRKFISSWDEATILSKELRETLKKECPIDITADVLVSKEKDSIKAKIKLKDGLEIETVMMRHIDGRNTVCVSSQVGCPLKCKFCATGMMGFKRDLTHEEIIEQVVFFERYLKGERVTNVTFMGMGEPFLNYDNVMKAIRFLNKELNIGARSMSVSTAGIVEGINKFADEGLQVNLAISLHAPNDKLRSELIPIDKKYPLKKLLKAVDEYILKTNRQVMFEYLLIKDINDSDKHAEELAKLIKKPLYFLNLIMYNPTGVFEPSKRSREFKDKLNKLKVNFSERHRFGEDIKAACGQFYIK